jgi:hypothetical protein
MVDHDSQTNDPGSSRGNSNFRYVLWLCGAVGLICLGYYFFQAAAPVKVEGLQWACQVDRCDVSLTIENKRHKAVEATVFIDANKSYRRHMVSGRATSALDRVGSLRLGVDLDPRATKRIRGIVPTNAYANEVLVNVADVRETRR